MSGRACVLLRQGPAYRREKFVEGVARAGYAVQERPLPKPEPGDLLVMWNRYSGEEGLARNYQSSGADIVVAENGYIGTDDEGGKLFALSRNYHNGAGEWNQGPQGRWKTELKPWRKDGDFILLLPQRGIGPVGVAMPSAWLDAARRRLQELTKRPVRIRRHPGPSKTDPYEDLKGAWAAVTWGSGAGLKALLAGYPVFSDFGKWIGLPAASSFMPWTKIEEPFLGDRLPMFERLAWAQWSLKEIASGEAFIWLLGQE